MKIALFCLAAIAALNLVSAQYEANWESLDSRPLPEWYDKAKFGIFLHWGIYAVPSFGSEWFMWSWLGDKDANYQEFMSKNYPPNFTYQDFATQFTTEFYDPNEWVDLIAKAGAKYVVLTSKHHEGYALWPSKYSYSWNSMDVGPHRDLLGELAEAVRAKGLTFGVYHSLLEWFHPLYDQDKANGWNTTEFVDLKVIPEMKELVNTYKPDVIWSDGNWESDDIYWKSTDFLAWLYNESPVKDTIVVNDRWGDNTQCLHGDFLTCADKYLPDHVMGKKWESCMSIDTVSWGYRRTAKINEFLSAQEMINTLVKTVSYGGNLLLNLGPTKEGTISPIFQERLLQMGEWLDINGAAIYESSAWTSQNDSISSNVWYTTRDSSVYVILLEWPEDNVVHLGDIAPLFSGLVRVHLLGNEEDTVSWVISDHVSMTLPDFSVVKSQWAWVIEIAM